MKQNNPFGFAPIWVDERLKMELKSLVENTADDYEYAVSELNELGLPSDKATITAIAKNLHKYITDHRNEYLDRLGSVILSERNRITRAYTELQKSVEPLTKYIRKAVNNADIVFDDVDGKYTINITKSLNKAFNACSYVVDIENMTAVYEKLTAANKTISELIEAQDTMSVGLNVFMFDEYEFNENGKIEGYAPYNARNKIAELMSMTPKEFEGRYARYFIKKK